MGRVKTYKSTPEYKKEYARVYRDANRERKREYERDYKQTPQYQEYSRRYQFSRYGITVEDYERMLQDQGGVCAICGYECPTGRSLAIDHDHKCCPQNGRSCGKCVRGLLCLKCNRGIGLFNDDDQRLAEAQRYLERHYMNNDTEGRGYERSGIE